MADDKQQPFILPPLPHHLALEVNNHEVNCERLLRDCWSGVSFNSMKAQRVLKSAANEIVLLTEKHYRTRSDFYENWVNQIENETVSSLLCFLPFEASHFTEPLRKQIKNALTQERSAKASSPIKPLPETPTTPAPTPLKTISQRLDEALPANRSHEWQAEQIGISRTAYFEVKAGRGGPKSRRRAENYLVSLLSYR